MRFYADLHIHSKYSRATSRNCDLEHLAWWAKRKGITVVATGDFTHPAWFAEIQDKLVPAEPGLFRLRDELERDVERLLPSSCTGRPVRFLLEVEISTIYKKGERTRKVHHLIYAPDLDTASKLREQLERIGNLASDGRPILGLDSRHLLEITLESGPGAYLVPAHIWTPWFAVLGSKSGFDTVEECYGDLAEHIFAIETGLSSDPPMNWRVSHLDRFTLVSNSDAHSPPMLGREACVFDTELDYYAIRRALESGDGYDGTVEFFPEEGKYHLDGHRACQVRCEPEETRRHGGRCPTCGKPLTVGVMHRVEELADRPEPFEPEGPKPFRSLIPLPEIFSEVSGVGARSKTVERQIATLVTRLGPELDILETLPLEEVRRVADPRIAEALARLRSGQVRRDAGYDGEYGKIYLFEPGELKSSTQIAWLFGEDPPSASSDATTTKKTKTKTAKGVQAVPGSADLPEEQARLSRGPGELLPAGEVLTPPTPLSMAGEGGGRRSSLLVALDSDQRVAAEIVDGPLLIVAGPGTGKTRTLTYRLAHLVAEVGVAPEACLAVTFTRRAAEEMSERLEQLLPSAASRLTVTTFHGLGLRILRQEHAELGLDRAFRVADPSACVDLARELFAYKRSQAEKLLKAFGELRRARATGDEAEDAVEGGAWLGRQLVTYRQALWAGERVDFDDLLALPVELLDAREDLRRVYQARYRFVSIDEYQDIDALQYRLIRLLVPSDGNLCAIGDPDQSIYRFRGAEVGFFMRFAEDFPAARTVQLGRNYRSSRVVVEAARQAIAPTSLVADRRLEAVDAGTAVPIVVREAGSPRAEAEGVVHTIEKLLGGTSYFSLDSQRVGEGDEAGDLSFDDFAVLYRTEAQAAVVAEALSQAGMPFQKRSHARWSERPAIRAIVEALEEAVEKGDVDGQDESAATWLERLVADLRSSSGEAAAEELGEAYEILAPLAARHGADVAGFLSELVLGIEVDTWDPRAERVSLLTLHAAKGLEFQVVFIIGCEDGLLPLRFASDQEELDEERRLFFVGLTRARQRLYLSHALRRSVKGELRDVRPSSFLRDIDAGLFVKERDEPSSKRRSEPPEESGQLSLL